MSKRRAAAIAVGAAVAAFLAACALSWLLVPGAPYEGAAARTVERGTSYQFRAYGRDAQNALDAAAIRIQALDNTVEGHPGADVDRINESAGTYVAVDPSTLYLLRESLSLRDRLPGFSVCQPGMEALSLRFAEGQAAVLPESSLSLQPMLPGYAADQAASVVRDYGIDSALLQIDGSIAVAVGARQDGGYWTIQVPHPLGEDAALGILVLRDRAVATVAATEGAEASFTSVTVTANTALEAIGLARTVMRLPPDQGLALIHALPDAQMICAMSDGGVYWTSGMDEFFSLRAPGFFRADGVISD